MLCILKETFRLHRVTGCQSITPQLHIFVGYVLRRAAHLYAGAIAFIDAVCRVGLPAIA